MAEIKIQSIFAKANQNVFNNDVCEIMNEGIEELSKTLKDNNGNPKKLWNFEIKIPDGEIKICNFNNSSLRSFIDAWGRDTKNWVGKKIKAEIVKVQAFGKVVDSIHWKPVE